MAFDFRPSRAASRPDHFTCWRDNFGFRLWVGDLFSITDFWVISCDCSCLLTSNVWEPWPGCRGDSRMDRAPTALLTEYLAREA